MNIAEKATGIINAKNFYKILSIAAIVAVITSIYVWYRNRLANEMAEMMFLAYKLNNAIKPGQYGYYKDEFVPLIETRFRKQSIFTLRENIAKGPEYWQTEVAKMVQSDTK